MQVTPRASALVARQGVSTRLIFLVVGFESGAWAPLVPFAKARLGIDDGVLGLLLLSLGVGSIIAMPAAGAVAGRLGCRRVIVTAVLAFCLAMPVLAWASSLPLMIAGLAVFGAGIGATDVAVNIQAIIVERESRRPLMSGFHGFYSLGGILGALGATGLLAADAAPLATMLLAGAAGLAALAVAAPHLLTYGGHTGGPSFALPRGVVWLIGAVCFTLFLTEGSVLDWSAVFLSSVRGMATSAAGLGYAAFAVTMTLGRLTGDRIVHRFGGGNVILFGGLCAATGFAVATLVPSWPVAVAGYALVGVGCSNIVPVLFSSAGRQTAMPESIAVPAVTTLGYAGILIGPAAIGLVAHLASLPVAFAMLALALLGVAASGRLLGRLV
ncbi:MAG TPA: MFS transporter [Caulobacteraceae bacterium]|jgi:MFS family permease|nr:MFS transporter [Caulobacteraceae bacterium]